MSRSLDDLRPEFRAMVDAWLGELPVDILITCTLRSNAEQDALYAIGRTAPGIIRTNARAGQSAHQYGLALDFVVMDHGKCDWSGTSAAWNTCIALAERHGMESLRPMESAHLQHPKWKLLKDQQHA